MLGSVFVEGLGHYHYLEYVRNERREVFLLCGCIWDGSDEKTDAQRDSRLEEPASVARPLCRRLGSVGVKQREICKINDAK